MYRLLLIRRYKVTNIISNTTTAPRLRETRSDEAWNNVGSQSAAAGAYIAGESVCISCSRRSRLTAARTGSLPLGSLQVRAPQCSRRSVRVSAAAFDVSVRPYTLRKGDSLQSIAKKRGKSLRARRRRCGQVQPVEPRARGWPPAPPSASGAQPTAYTASSDHLCTILTHAASLPSIDRRLHCAADHQHQPRRQPRQGAPPGLLLRLQPISACSLFQKRGRAGVWHGGARSGAWGGACSGVVAACRQQDWIGLLHGGPGAYHHHPPHPLPAPPSGRSRRARPSCCRPAGCRRATRRSWRASAPSTGEGRAGRSVRRRQRLLGGN